MPPDGGDGAAAPEAVLSRPRKVARPYQAKGLEEARAAFRAGKRAVLFVLPTGGGKTFIGSMVCEGALAKGGNVIWLAHREELLTQAQVAIMAEGLTDVGIIAPWARRQHAKVQVASTQTLLAQMKKGRDLPRASIVVADEAHHYAADEWKEVLAAIKDQNGNPPRVLGLTATPERGDGRALGDMFDCLIPVSSVRELQGLGVLVPCVTYAPETRTKALAREPVDAYREHGFGERCFVFCVTVSHAEMIAETFRRAGVPAATIHADTPWGLRRARLEAFRLQDPAPLRKAGSAEDAPLVLCNVYTLTEGVDVPAASVCITARGIGHGGMMRQMVGRVLRASPGKERAIWWDLRGQHHKRKIGLPESDCAYSLEGRAIEVQEDIDDPPKKCKACEAIFVDWAVDKATGARRCPACGEPAPAIILPEVEEREVFAVGSGVNDKTRREALDRLAVRAAEMGRKPGWVKHRFAEMFQQEIDWKDVEAANLRARQLLGIRPDPNEIGAERARLEQIAAARGIPRSWVDKKLAAKFGKEAA